MPATCGLGAGRPIWGRVINGIVEGKGNVERLSIESIEYLKNSLHVGTLPIMANDIIKAFDELIEYKKLEEKNRLLKLPCAVGDTVYTLNPLMNGKTVIGETTADAFMCALGMLEGRFGKTIFLTLKEAEVALKELEDKEE